MEEGSGTNKITSEVRLSGYYICRHPQKTVEFWLEEDGFFKLKYEEREDDGSFASNEERGSYSGDNKSFLLSAVERSWKWKDGNEQDSGVDATDLKYPATIKSDSEIVVHYLETDYSCKKE